MKKVIILSVFATLLSWSTIAQPTGSITAFGGPKAKIPSGWVACDGTLYDRTNATYRRLFDVIGVSWGGDGANKFAVPDLKGLFLRGVSEDTDNDPEKGDRSPSRTDLKASGNKNNEVGSKQQDAFGSHVHSYTDRQEGAGNDVDRDTDVGLNKVETKNTAAAGGSETRPKNAYVYFIIKL